MKHFVSVDAAQKFGLLLLLLVALEASSLEEADVFIFKGDPNGILHFIGDGTKITGSVSAITDNKLLCGRLNKAEGVVDSASGRVKTDPECRGDFSSSYRLDKLHMFSKKESPLAIGVKGCDIDVLRDNAVFPSPQLLSDFKSKNGLPEYFAETSKVFASDDGAKILYFVGIKAKTVTGKNSEVHPVEVDGVSARDLFLIDVKTGGFLLERRDQVCCDPKTENFHLCHIPNQVKSACFDPTNGLEKIKGIFKDKKGLYTYAVNSSVEGVHGNVWKLEGNDRKKVFHKSFYAPDGCH